MAENNRNALARRTPANALARSEDWARLSADDRKRRAAIALRDNDREALWGLTQSYVLTFGRRGLRVSEHTLAQYRRGLDAVADWCEAAGPKAHQLDRQAALRFARHLEALGLAPASVNVRLSGARAFMAALAWAGMREGDPFAKVSVSDPTPSWEKRRPYSEAELAKLLATGSPWERALVLVAADGGLRASEIVALDWADVDLPGRLLVVRSGKGAKQRTIPISQRLADTLAALVPEPSGVIFDYSRRRADQIFRRLCKDAGVTCRGLHAARHRCGTQLARTVGLLATARHLGHASTRPTEGYAHVSPEDYRAGVDALGGAASSLAA